MRHLSLTVLYILIYSVLPGQNIVTYGLFTGATIPLTFDAGINNDPRYEARYDVKFSPVGIHYGVDYDGYGFIISPSLIKTGQNFNVINTVGGEVGTRKLDMTYLNVPISLKLHIIDLSFFKLSFVASGAFAYLIDGKETITHSYSKLRFPSQVIPNLPPDYTAQYDGVQSPEVRNYSMLSNGDFNPFQINVAGGFRSDWELSETLHVSLDLRANYGILEPRSNSYLQRLNSYSTLYDVPGSRRDMFVYFTVGLSRYLEIDKKEKDRKRITKGSSHLKASSHFPWPKPRNRSPRH